MTLLQPDDLRVYLDTDQYELAWQIAVSEEAEIIRRCGPHASASVTRMGGDSVLTLGRPAASITSITEAGTTLTTDDYELIGTSILRRVGCNWGGPVVITYVPQDTTEQRKTALIQLVRLGLAYSGYQSVSIPEIVNFTIQDVLAERERILRSLGASRIVFA